MVSADVENVEEKTGPGRFGWLSDFCWTGGNRSDSQPMIRDFPAVHRADILSPTRQERSSRPSEWAAYGGAMDQSEGSGFRMSRAQASGHHTPKPSSPCRPSILPRPRQRTGSGRRVRLTLGPAGSLRETSPTTGRSAAVCEFRGSVVDPDHSDAGHQSVKLASSMTASAPWTGRRFLPCTLVWVPIRLRPVLGYIAATVRAGDRVGTDRLVTRRTGLVAELELLLAFNGLGRLDDRYAKNGERGKEQAKPKPILEGASLSDCDDPHRNCKKKVNDPYHCPESGFLASGHRGGR